MLFIHKTQQNYSSQRMSDERNKKEEEIERKNLISKN